MRIRVDSPFHGIPEDLKQHMLDLQDMGTGLLEISEIFMEDQQISNVSVNQVKKFLARARFDEALRNTDDSGDGMENFVERGKDGRARDGQIEAARQKLFEEALAAGNNELLLKLYEGAHRERVKERELEVSKRKAAVAEEKAKLGWRRFEWKKAQSAVRLLPKIRELLMDGTAPAEERVAKALEVLMVGGGKLLEVGTEVRTEGEKGMPKTDG